MKLNRYLAVALCPHRRGRRPRVHPGDRERRPRARGLPRGHLPHLAHRLSREGHRHAQEPGRPRSTSWPRRSSPPSCRASSATSRPSTTPAWPSSASPSRPTTPRPRARTTRPCSTPPRSSTPSTRPSSGPSGPCSRRWTSSTRSSTSSYHKDLPDKKWDNIRAAAPDLKAKAEAVTQAKLPARLAAQEGRRSTPRPPSSSRPPRPWPPSAAKPTAPRSRAAVLKLHTRYQDLEKIFD